MISITIILIGLIFFILNGIRWIRIKRRIHKSNDKIKIKKILYKNYFSKTKLKDLYTEWLCYNLNIFHERKIIHFLTPVTSFVFIIIINNNLLKINLSLLLIVFLSILFFIQIKLYRASKRKYFNNHFPEVLLLVNMAASSGTGIIQVLERCGQEISGSLGDEFRLICRRLHIGESPEVVFDDAYKKFNYPEFYFFINTILLNIKQGGQLKALLSKLSNIIAKTKAMEQRKQVMTAEVRMSASVISIIPFFFLALFFYLDPESLINMYESNIGSTIIYYAILSNVIGISIIRIMLRKVI